MTEKKPNAGSDAARTDSKAAEKNREDLKKNAENGLKDSVGNLPEDQV